MPLSKIRNENSSLSKWFWRSMVLGMFLDLEVIASIEQRNDDEILLWGIYSKSIIPVMHTVKRLN